MTDKVRKQEPVVRPEGDQETDTTEGTEQTR